MSGARTTLTPLPPYTPRNPTGINASHTSRLAPGGDHESTPLIPGRPDDKRRNRPYRILALIIIAAVVTQIAFFLCNYQYLQNGTPSQRQQWEQELKDRRQEESARIGEWEQELEDRRREESTRIGAWEQELEDRRREERARIGKWEQELENHQREERARIGEWERELRRHRLDEEIRMTEWEQEFSKRQREEIQRQTKWERELREHRREEAVRQEREKGREAQWQREEEERERLGLYWDLPQEDAHCTGYNMRHYSARLLNTVPYDYNWLKPCEEMPLVIHGRSVQTSRCEIQGSGIVYGHWTIDFDEPLCSPYWDQFKDKGCTAEGSHHRRYEAHLENVHDGEDAEALCASAPNDFEGLHLDRPTSCANWGQHGVFGIWEVEDQNC